MRFDIAKAMRDGIIQSAVVQEDHVLIDEIPSSDWDHEPTVVVSVEQDEIQMALTGPVCHQMVIAVICLAKTRDEAQEFGNKAFDAGFDAVDALWGLHGISGVYPISESCGPVQGNSGPKRDEFLFTKTMQVFQK